MPSLSGPKFPDRGLRASEISGIGFQDSNGLWHKKPNDSISLPVAYGHDVMQVRRNMQNHHNERVMGTATSKRKKAGVAVTLRQVREGSYHVGTLH